MMREIYLHGALRKYHLLYGRESFVFDVETASGAVRALASQCPEFDRDIRKGLFRVRCGPLGRGGRTLRHDQAHMRLGKHAQIHITPRGEAAWGGNNRAMGKIMVGVALLAVGVTGGLSAGFAAGVVIGETTVASFGSLALSGASMALTGLSAVLAPDPQIGSYATREAPEDRPNFMFTGAVNQVNEGACVPWIYGKRVRVGSVVINAGIIDEQTGPGLPEVADGLIATFATSATSEVVPGGE